MPHLAELLRTAAGDIEPSFRFVDLERRRRQRRRRRRAAVIGVGVGVACVIIAATATVDQQPQEVATQGRSSTTAAVVQDLPVWATKSVLLLDDGYDGVVAVDLARRLAARHVIDGQRAGDSPYRLLRVGDSLVVGWGEIFAAPLDGGPVRSLGEATVAIPAAEPGHVWLVDYPGGRLGEGTPTLRLVHEDGTVIASGMGPELTEYHYPVQGVPGGVAFDTGSGVAIWKVATETVTRLGTVPANVADVADDVVVWCERVRSTCGVLHLSRLDGRDRTIGLDRLGLGAVNQLRFAFSPDGATLAGGLYGEDGTAVVLIDTASGSAELIELRRSGSGVVSWSPDGTVLYIIQDAGADTGTMLTVFEPSTGRRAQTLLPFSVSSFEAVAPDEASKFFPEDVGTAASCPPPSIYPSGRTGTCGFPY